MNDNRIDALEDINKMPFQLLESLLNHNYQFTMNHYPKVEKSNETPPIEINKRSETIPIDKCLGAYSPTQLKIVIFTRGVESVSSILECKPNALERIVEIHEYAHAILHMGVTKEDNLKILKDDSIWGRKLLDSTAIYNGIDRELHEKLAQLFTYHALGAMRAQARTVRSEEVIGRLVNLFTKLNHRQPHEYQVDNLIGIQKDRLVKSFDLLKRGVLPGRSNLWLEVFTW